MKSTLSKREQLASRLGFILLSAGCAIGIGNVWKFPYIAGIGGGGAFVIIYLLFLTILGLPVLIMEFSVGRASQSSPLYCFKKLEPKNTKWHIHGILCLIGAMLLMMFYTTVAAWMIHFFYLTASGQLTGNEITNDIINSKFTEIINDKFTLAMLVIIVCALGSFVCAGGVAKSLEKITKWMMLALIIIMIILAINSCFMAKAKEGLSFFLIPDFSRMKEIGIFNTCVMAMNQSFFTLSLGIGSMAIFGSYLNKKHTLPGESLRVILLDTAVAICAGLIIFPACFTYGVDVNAGPPLIFMTLPNIFKSMAGGRIWGSLFFVFMSFAALSTVFAVFEEIISCLMELKKFKRKKASFIIFITLSILSLPCVYGFGALTNIPILNKIGTDILDVEDFIVSNCLLPLGSLVFCLFCVSRYGFGWKNFTKECNTGKGLKLANGTRFYLTYILPVIILALFVIGLYDKFFAK